MKGKQDRFRYESSLPCYFIQDELNLQFNVYSYATAEQVYVTHTHTRTEQAKARMHTYNRKRLDKQRDCVGKYSETLNNTPSPHMKTCSHKNRSAMIS